MTRFLLSAARLAALGAGLIPDLTPHVTEAPAVWTPRMDKSQRESLLGGWRRAVRAAITETQ